MLGGAGWPRPPAGAASHSLSLPTPWEGPCRGRNGDARTLTFKKRPVRSSGASDGGRVGQGTRAGPRKTSVRRRTRSHAGAWALSAERGGPRGRLGGSRVRNGRILWFLLRGTLGEKSGGGPPARDPTGRAAAELPGRERWAPFHRRRGNRDGPGAERREAGPKAVRAASPQGRLRT